MRLPMYDVGCTILLIMCALYRFVLDVARTQEREGDNAIRIAECAAIAPFVFGNGYEIGRLESFLYFSLRPNARSLHLGRRCARYER